MIVTRIHLSIIRQIIHVKDTGLYREGSDVSPLLKIPTIFEVLQALGTIPDCIDLVKIIFRYGINISLLTTSHYHKQANCQEHGERHLIVDVSTQIHEQNQQRVMR